MKYHSEDHPVVKFLAENGAMSLAPGDKGFNDDDEYKKKKAEILKEVQGIKMKIIDEL